MDGKERSILQLIGIALAMGMLLSSGCASKNVILSRQKVSQAEKDIHEAKASNASLGAPVELTTAEGKFSLAKEALAKEEYEKAGRLADEASVDAEYARVKATSEKNKKTAAEMRKNIESLRQEIQHQSK
jgi:outer membrane murein-binding lipoprotein Lpp